MDTKPVAQPALSLKETIAKALKDEKPQFRNAHDVIALVLHLVMKGTNFKCVGTGEQNIDPNGMRKFSHNAQHWKLQLTQHSHATHTAHAQCLNTPAYHTTHPTHSHSLKCSLFAVANETLIPNNWNQSNDAYALRYRHPQSSMTFLIKSLVVSAIKAVCSVLCFCVRVGVRMQVQCVVTVIRVWCCVMCVCVCF